MMDIFFVWTFLVISFAAAQDDSGLLLTVIPSDASIARLRVIREEAGTYNFSSISGIGFESMPELAFISCDLDYKGKRMFLFEIATKSIIIGSNFTTTFENPVDFNYAHYGLGDARVAYDWISNNFYWTDSVYKRIGMQSAVANASYNSMYNIIVHQHLGRPVGIFVDPVNKYLFWTDTDTSTPKIERSDLTGNMRTLLVTRALLRPTSIVSDIAEQRIYWTDADRNTIETATYSGSDRRLLSRLEGSTLYDIAVSQDHIIVTNTEENDYFVLVNKDPAVDLLFRSIGNEKAYGVAVYDAYVQPEAQDMCNTSGCGDLCTNTNTSPGYKCLCREGYKLDTDGTTCIEDKSKFHRGLLFCNTSTICRLDERSLAQFYDVDCFFTLQSEMVDGRSSEIGFLEVDTTRRKILFATADSVYTLDIDQPTPQVLLLFSLAVAPGTISGISYHWIDSILYVSDSKGDIYAINIDTKVVIGIHTDLDNPRAILVVPLERKLYWISGSTNFTIKSSTIGVSGTVDLVSSSLLTRPRDLANDLQLKRIFWVDSQKVWSCKYDGSDVSVFRSTPYTAYLITIYKDFLVWMLEISGLSYMSADHMGKEYRINSRRFDEVGFVKDLEVIDESIQPVQKEPCDAVSSPCQHICISTPDGVSCHCETGFQTLDNGITCFSDPTDKNFALVADWTNNRMYLVDLVTGTFHGIATLTTLNPTAVLYDPDKEQVIWSSVGRGAVLAVNINGTNEHVLGTVGSVYLERLALDETSNNIFYAAVHLYSYVAPTWSYIGVMSPSGLHSIIIEDLHYPSDIAIHAEDGLLFYAERGQPYPHIGRAYMDGSNVTHIVTQDLLRPKAIVIDYITRRLYWADSLMHQISSVNFDGSDRQLFIEDQGANLIDLDIDLIYIYYIGGNRQHITRANKTDATDVAQVAPSAEFGRLEALFVYSESYARPPINSLCQPNLGKADCGSFCLPNAAGYVCACQEGYFLLQDAKTCDNGVDDCLDVTCENNGTCEDRIDDFKCICQPGYNDTLCTNNIDECVGVTCQYGGSCQDGINNYTCECAAGFTGRHCEMNIDECIGVTCDNNGSCVDAINSYQCQCVPGYTGTHCENEIDECIGVVCSNGGSCEDMINNYTCQCVDGFTGRVCEINIDECIGVACSNGGTCKDLINSYSCDCVDGYSGDHCEDNIDECIGVTCNNGGTCEDRINAYSCKCIDGYSGIHCEEDINECLGVTCSNGGTCKDGVNDYTCQCVLGYTGSHCEQDIDECIGVTCSNGGSCEDGINSYTCICATGYTGTHCEQDINECQGVVCQHGGTCNDEIGHYTCSCVTGYSGDHCEININDCVGVTCNNGGSCNDGLNSYTCQCIAGYTGTHCDTDINECEGITCANGGACEDKINAYKCNCVTGYTGNLCETNIDDCASVTCNNGGTCRDGVNTYSCQCVPGYQGIHCETNINECIGVTCQNGGTCKDGINGYICQCISGFIGTNCETNRNDCVNATCQNGATCKDGINDYVCQCLAGYTGTSCETDINECEAVTCQNNGTCVDQINTFTCQCEMGYKGTLCERVAAAEESSMVGPIVGGTVAALVVLAMAIIAIVVIMWRRRKSMPKHERFYSRSDMLAAKNDTMVSTHPQPKSHKSKSSKGSERDLRHTPAGSRASVSSTKSLRPQYENEIAYLGMTNPVYDMYGDEQGPFRYETVSAGSTRPPSIAESYAAPFPASYAQPIIVSRPPSMAESHGPYESIRSSQLSNYKPRDNRKRHSSSRR